MMPGVARFEYLTVREVGEILNKRKSRVYTMIATGLLAEVGFQVVRTDRKRIWIGVPASFRDEKKALRSEAPVS